MLHPRPVLLAFTAFTVVGCTPEPEEAPLDLGCTPVGEEVVEAGGMGILLTPADLEPFCGATTIRGSLIFGTDADLTGWDGLRALGAVEIWEGGLWVQTIEETIGLPRLREIESLVLQGPAIDPPDLAALQTAARLEIDGFEGAWHLPELRRVGTLRVGDGITEVTGLGQLATVTELIEINSATLTTVPLAPLLSTVEGSVRMSQSTVLSQVALFSSTEHIHGSLEITQTGLTSLGDFASLQSVGASLQGQDAGLSLYGFALVNNTELGSLSGLDNLRTVRGSMLVLDNWNLASLDGFAVQAWEATDSDVFTQFEVVGTLDSSGDISALLGLLTAELPVPCDIVADEGTGVTEAQMLQLFEACQGG